MILKNKLALALLLLLTACTSSPSSNPPSESPEKPPAWGGKSRYADTALYIRVGNPDTALAFFLYKNRGQIDYFDHIEGYCRLWEEREEIYALYRSLFKDKQDLEAHFAAIEENEERMMDSLRNEMKEDFEKGYYYTDSKAFGCLFNRKDKGLIRMMQTYLKSAKISAEDKKEMREDLAKLGVAD